MSPQATGVCFANLVHCTHPRNPPPAAGWGGGGGARRVLHKRPCCASSRLPVSSSTQLAPTWAPRSLRLPRWLPPRRAGCGRPLRCQIAPAPPCALAAGPHSTPWTPRRRWDRPASLRGGRQGAIGLVGGAALAVAAGQCWHWRAVVCVLRQITLSGLRRCSRHGAELGQTGFARQRVMTPSVQTKMLAFRCASSSTGR